MSDVQFFKTFFGMVFGLALLAAVLFVITNVVGGTDKLAAANPATVEQRIQPVGRVSIAQPIIDTLIPAANAAADGQEFYQVNCASCHDNNVANAPKPGDKAAWASRIAKGLEALKAAGRNGLPGTVMLPKGGNPALADADVDAAVEYMYNASK